MPSLSYKDRFCRYVKEGSKTQTIRAFRKRPFKVGDQLSHFYGLRTKNVTRLIPGTTTCINVQTIYILENGKVCIGPNVPEEKAKYNLKLLSRSLFVQYLKNGGIKRLDEGGKNILAWADGFRQNDDPTQPNTECWQLMYSWWKDTHALPFTGQILYWNKP